MKSFHFFLALLAVILAAFISVQFGPVVALLCLALAGASLSPRAAIVRDVTLSVPEILMDVLDAFRVETPQLFGPDGFATDFSSKTAVLGDKITAHVSHVPVTGAYDKDNGGFKAAAQNVTTLIEDVPVTLNRLIHVPVNIPWLTQTASKLPLYREAVRNLGSALGKKVVDTCLQQALNFSHTILLPPPLVNLDSMEDLRTTLNAQHAAQKGRFGFVNAPFAAALQNDDRTKSDLFYGQRNEANGYRVFRNIAGCQWIREYPEIDTLVAPFIGFFADRRAICVATRRPDFSNAAEELGLPKVMDFYPMEEPESGLSLMGVSWQEVGTGDIYVSVAILFGVGAGNQGGAPGSMTDNAGLLVRAA